MQKKRTLESVIKSFLRESFQQLKITDVKIERGQGYFGDDVLRVQVIYEGNYRDIDGEVFSGLVRMIEPRLAEIGETAFPLFSFVSRDDFEAAA